VRPALVNGAAGAVVFDGAGPISVMGFTVSHGKIVEIDVLGDPARLRQLAMPAFGAQRRVVQIHELLGEAVKPGSD
jgi:hypothetical protein